jgi:hypothetical protein
VYRTAPCTDHHQQVRPIMSKASGPPAAAAPLRVEGRVLGGALEMRHDGSGGRGYYIAARAHIPKGANLLQVPAAAMLAHAGHSTHESLAM